MSHDLEPCSCSYKVYYRPSIDLRLDGPLIMSLSIPEQDVDSDSFSVSTLGRSSPLYRVSSNGSRNAAKALGGTSGISPADHEEATLRKSCRSPSRTPTTVSQSEGYEAGTTTIRRPAPAEDRLSCPPSSCRSWKAALRHSWSRNKGVALVLLSQFFGALMNVTTRLLETDGDGMHPLQVCFDWPRTPLGNGLLMPGVNRFSLRE